MTNSYKCLLSFHLKRVDTEAMFMGGRLKLESVEGRVS
jgi:hypothetical protein